MTAKPIKVFHLIDSGGLYGAEKMLLSLCQEQVKQGLEPTILSCGVPEEPEKPLEAEALRLGLDVIPWRMKAGLNVFQTARLIKEAKNVGVSVLHSHGYKFNILLALLYPLVRSFMLITTVHGYVQAKKWSAMWLYEILDKFSLRTFDKVVLVSQNMLDIKGIKKLPQNKKAVVGNGISVAFEASPLSPSVKSFRKKYSVCLVAVGRLSPEKGFDVLFQALFELFCLNSSLRDSVGLVVFGDGGKRVELKGLKERLSLQDNILMAGYESNVSSVLPYFDMLVMPSYTEGTPITLLEAMRAKCPILATEVGGIPALLNDSSAYLVEPGKSGIIAAVLLDSIKKPDIAHKKSDEAYREFIHNHSSKVMSDSYLNIYIDTESH